jgi:hypothetical protein
MKSRSKSCAVMMAIMVALALTGWGADLKSATDAGEWVWESGTDSLDQSGTYGQLGVASPGNIPGARVYASTWTDRQGAFWLFGGYGYDSAANGGSGDLNDLWKYQGGEWTWMGGSSLVEEPGTYGTRRKPSGSNAPGARYQATSWTDAKGNFWLFGGLGIDSTGTRGQLNDLWKYSNGQWTWMAGSTRAFVAGKVLTKIPSARVSASSWTDLQGNLWLFGGDGFDSTGKLGILNDLWKFSQGKWIWIGGSKLANQFGKYGTKGLAGRHNFPGARAFAVTWTDATGDLWLFGGLGNDKNGRRCTAVPNPCDLNDLWKYSAGLWTWMGGSNRAQQWGEYGTQGVASPENMPGARDSAISWTDAAGNFWLFGGYGYDSSNLYFGDMSDLWEFTAGKWTWISGPNLAGETGTYGDEGIFAPNNIPGCRDSAVNWIDPAGNLWLFGGSDRLTVPLGGKFNDLWEYQP